MADALISFKGTLFLSASLLGSSALFARSESSIHSSDIDWTGRLFFAGFLLLMMAILFALVNFVLAQPKPHSN